MRTYKTYVQKEVYILIHMHPTCIYGIRTHTQTHAHTHMGFHPLKSMKAAAIGQSEDMARPTDGCSNPSAVVKMPETLEFCGERLS